MENTDIFMEHENIFQIDYEGQNLIKSEAFIKWQVEMKKRYGNDAKLFKCNNDKIYYYGSIQDCRTIPLYKVKCPICKYTICYYCSRHVDDFCDAGNCCIYRRIHCLFFQGNFIFIKDKESRKCDFLVLYIIFLLPFISFMFFVGTFYIYFYYNLYFDNGESDDEDNCYRERIKSSTVFFIIVFFNTLFTFFLSIPFFFYDLAFKIILQIISLPFKNYPMRYYLSIIDFLKGY